MAPGTNIRRNSGRPGLIRRRPCGRDPLRQPLCRCLLAIMSGTAHLKDPGIWHSVFAANFVPNNANRPATMLMPTPEMTSFRRNGEFPDGWAKLGEHRIF